MFQNKIVDEVRELVIQDYFAVMMLIVVRLQVLSERLIKLGGKPVDDSGLNVLSLVLVRLEECKESLSGYFWRYRRLAEDFWCLAEMLKAETAKDNKEMVEFVGSVQITVKDDEEMVELACSVQIEWVTLDDTETATHEVVPWDSKWVKFDDPNGLTNESVWLSPCTTGLIH
ncbi:PREDICTED: putative clathrin assembly protein At5g10410 [Camelina sativa]|uniref:Clathrin assembly protein At5g10410 n=1 Tax=Camelina sativa TaxID=90675 RepID=A0ABM0VIK4_CAMSA|nr:PREDICTED: putative clathrin assembly protein At5g10410 [Camelina sativa]